MVGALALLALSGAPLLGCTDGDISKGCRNWCECHRGTRSESDCRSSCEKTLTELKKRDRTRARQVADCLAAKGKRDCKELALCAQGALK